MPFKKLWNTIELIRCFGVRRILFKLRYKLSKRMGGLKRKFPAYSWSDKRYIDICIGKKLDPDSIRSKLGNSNFFFNEKNLSEISSFLDDRLKSIIIQSADDIISGHIRYFSKHTGYLGNTPNWFTNPFTKQHSSNDKHWCDIPDFLPSQGDIKFIWEPSRFVWVYILVRAYAITSEERYPQTFWKFVKDWKDNNPPQIGANWKCGQECAFRIMALCFGLFGFLNSPSTTNEQINQIVLMIAVHAERIERNIDYAISQKNNHSISEAMGLYTVGVLFPWLKKAKHWKELGKDLLVREGLRQIYPDGSFVQHSMNYHRLMLQDYLWCVRLGQLNNDEFPSSLLNRLRKATNWLYQMMDVETGRVPNYGANDGALILPLNTCDYLDYRPVIQAMYYLLDGKRIFKPGPYDEDLIWLFGSDALESPIISKPPKNLNAKHGGYYTIRGLDSWGMVRCHTYQDSPHQADMLHFDLWYKGVNLLRDVGSFQYYCNPPWNHYFESTAAHNTVEVDGKDQMEKGSRFLWLNWTKSKLRHNEHLDEFDIDYWEGEHYGYRNGKNPVTHRRAIVRFKENYWIIVEDVLGKGNHSATLRWHLADIHWDKIGNGVFSTDNPNCQITVKAFPKDCHHVELLHGQEEPPEGWESLYYGERSAIPVIKSQIEFQLPLRFVTAINFSNNSFGQIERDKITISDENISFVLNQLSDKVERIITPKFITAGGSK